VGAIKVEYGRARISDLCKGCGKCVEACPTNSISLRIDDEAKTLKEVIGRIERRTNIGRLNGHQ